MNRQAILKLYKDTLRYGETLRFTDKKYFRYRIQTAFKNNKELSDKEEIDFHFKVTMPRAETRTQQGFKTFGSQESDLNYLTVPGRMRIMLARSMLAYLEVHSGICMLINRSKSFKRYLDYSNVPTLDETDLEEQFVRGSGPGGQATNKTNNAVLLKHKPTGLIIKCHETRSQSENRVRAREILLTKLDNLLNKERSIEAQMRVIEEKQKIRKDYKRKKLNEMKKAFRDREGLT